MWVLGWLCKTKIWSRSKIDIAEDVEIRFYSRFDHELDKSLPKAKNKNIVGLMKDELVIKSMTKCVRLKAKSYSYLIDDSSEGKKLCHKKKA